MVPNRTATHTAGLVAAALLVLGVWGCDEAVSPGAVDDPPVVPDAPSRAALFSEWDADSDGTLGEDEVVAGFDRYDIFARWDADRSGAVVPDEFYTTLYDVFDANDNGYLGPREWARGLARWMPAEADPPEFGTADTSDDLRLSTREFMGALADGALFAQWDDDGDGRLRNEEFLAHVYRTWDLDDDGRIRPAEFGF